MIHEMYLPIIEVVGNGRVAGKFAIIGHEGGPRRIRITGPSIIGPRFDFGGAWKNIGHFSRGLGLSAGFRSISSCSACLAAPVITFAGDIVAQAGDISHLPSDIGHRLLSMASVPTFCKYSDSKKQLYFGRRSYIPPFIAPPENR